MRTPTRFRHSLAFRIVVACALLGTGLSVLFAVSLFVATELLEDDLVAELLGDELGVFMLRAAEHDEAIEVQLSSRLRGYVAPLDRVDALPPWIGGLPVGLHELEAPDSQVYHVLVHESAGKRVVLTQDVTDIERRQRQLATLLIYGALAAAYLSIWIGWLLSRRVIAQLSRLSEAVMALPAEGEKFRLAESFANDEVGQLASTLDAYRSRLHAALTREREFSADASHELRTPLAVITGATEVLRGDAELGGRQRERLGRIERAAQAMGELIEVFLLLAREPSELDLDAFDLEELIAKVVEAECDDAARARVEVRVPARRVLCVQRRVAAIAIGNLVRNAAHHTRGSIEIVLEGKRLHVRDEGVDPGADTPLREQSAARPLRGGRGLMIVRRICERYGWRFDFLPLPEGGMDAVVDFGDALTEY